MNGSAMLRTGIYTVSDAAALLDVPGYKVRAWIDGWHGTNAPPIIANDLGWVDDKLAFSFANLMELRFISFFTKAGVSLPEIRSIMADVREHLKVARPFASNVVFKTDGHRILAEAVHRNGSHTLLDLRSRNYEMIEVTYRSLKSDVVYDASGIARAWYPRASIAPNVILHPSLSFGRPVLRQSGIPTEAIAQAVRAEGSAKAAAELFGVPLKMAREAAAFEDELRKAA